MGTERVLVTGATGFTGSHLCERLIRGGHAVRALVRSPAQCSGLRDSGVQVVPGDLRNPASLMKATQGIDVVYHIAALFRPENVSRKGMWETNVQGTRNILDASVKAGVRRFIHCSTVGVHGDITNPPANEDTPYGPGDYYQQSKTEGERLVLQYSAEGRLPIVVFRPGGIYGPRDLRFLKLFKGIKTRGFIMLGSGGPMYQMIYIDDLIEGILRCATNENAVGSVYILTGDEPVTVNRLIQLIAEALSVPVPHFRIPVTPVHVAGFVLEQLCKPFRINPPLYRKRVDFFRKTRCFDISRAKAQLGFQPCTDLRTGIKLTADWYRGNGYV